MPFVKHFVRMITPEQLDDDEVVDFYDIVQSHVPTKLVSAFTDDEEIVAVEVTHYDSDDGRNIYEIVLKEQMSESEGMDVAQELSDEFDLTMT